ncbi:MAG: hypothetical protein LBB85_01055 [Dysgonamonadaceae bacterium]|nr:hypothetical protein [Dysgonamonadaceae bacterium]
MLRRSAPRNDGARLSHSFASVFAPFRIRPRTIPPRHCEPEGEAIQQRRIPWFALGFALARTDTQPLSGNGTKKRPPPIPSMKKSEAGRILRVCIYRRLNRRRQS